MVLPFSRLSVQERLSCLKEKCELSEEEVRFLEEGGKPQRELADLLIENAIGYYALPLGFVFDLSVNNKNYIVPLVTEETSVIAALQKTVKWVKKFKGTVRASSMVPPMMIGQIHIPDLQDPSAFENILQKNQSSLIQAVHEGPARAMAKRGGGLKELTLRVIPYPGDTPKKMGVVHLHIAVQEAMGANLVTQVCEFVKSKLFLLTEEKMGMAIVSNLADKKNVRVSVALSGVSEIIGTALAEASLFAQIDPYRAVTHNKGILNGIDGVVMATGNDWRAVEAGLHGFAGREGQYRGLSTWYYSNGILEGHFEGPISVGLVGGVLSVHPGAKLCRKILNVHTSEELSHVIGAVGLLQNLGALRALVSGGIVQGHMALHIDNLLLAEGVPVEKRPMLKSAVQRYLKEKGYVRAEDIRELMGRETVT